MASEVILSFSLVLPSSPSCLRTAQTYSLASLEDGQGLVLQDESSQIVARTTFLSVAHAGSGKRRRDGTPPPPSFCGDAAALVLLHCMRHGIVSVLSPVLETIFQPRACRVRVALRLNNGIVREASANLDDESGLSYHQQLFFCIFRQHQESPKSQPLRPFSCMGDVIAACKPLSTALSSLHPALAGLDSVKFTRPSDGQVCRPFAYQRQAVHWMLTRELECAGGSWALDSNSAADSEAHPSSMHPLQRLAVHISSSAALQRAAASPLRVRDHPLWTRLPALRTEKGAQGCSTLVPSRARFFANVSTGWVVEEEKGAEGEEKEEEHREEWREEGEGKRGAEGGRPQCAQADAQLQPPLDGVSGGGLLCEEMGLGKTLEVLCLIHLRPFCPPLLPLPPPPSTSAAAAVPGMMAPSVEGGGGGGRLPKAAPQKRPPWTL